MPTQPRIVRTAAVLWFVAGALAFVAAAIPALKGGSPNWSVAAPGFFCIVMGIISWQRNQPPPPSS
jgi:hypothetical protein